MKLVSTFSNTVIYVCASSSLLASPVWIPFLAIVSLILGIKGARAADPLLIVVSNHSYF